jgi:succinate dehydrogenase/fumarate reductase flavoprotein subunit
MLLDQAKIEALIERSSDIYQAVSAASVASVHELIKLHEARNIAENARLIYLSALDRTESREQFYRTDYPQTDDESWFCLHGVTRTEAGPVFERIPIPLERFPLQRAPKASRHDSPIAAIFAGTYEPSHYE